MKKLFIFSAVLLFHFFCYSQTSFNYLEEVNRMVNVPNTPESEAFAQYGNVPVNLLVGAPDISVPIFIYKGREMDLPISLTYDINARKVEDIASSVGLGWNLNLGGRISRNVKGLPDDYFNVSGPQGGVYKTLLNNATHRAQYLGYKDKFFNHRVDPQYPPTVEFNTVADAEDYFELLYDIEQGEKDISSDNFSINVLGINEHIIFDEENGGGPTPMFPIPINNKRLKVTYLMGSNSLYSFIISWTVTDDSGTQYIFEALEQSRSQNSNDNGSTYNFLVEYTSSWLLTKIISPNGKDIFDFEYTNSGWYSQPSYTNTIHVTTVGFSTQRDEYDPENRYYHKQLFLSKVKHNNKEIVNISLGNRNDLDISNSAVKSITIKNPMDGSVVNHFKFDQSYFGSGQTGEFKKFRLKLDSLKVAGSDYDFSSNYDFKKKYSFIYDRPDEMPPRTTFAQDVLGFYNGKTDNDIGEGSPSEPEPYLFPQITLDPPSGPDIILSGADRSFDVDKSKIGILTRINYPTEGYSVFDYEANQYQYYDDIIQSVPIGNTHAKNSALYDATYCGANTCCESQTSVGEIAGVGSTTFFIDDNQNMSYDYKFKVLDRNNDNTNYRGYLIKLPDQNTLYNYEDICLGNVQPLYQFDHAPLWYDEEIVENQTLEMGYYQILVVNLDDDSVACTNYNIDCSTVYFTVTENEYLGQNLVVVEYPGLRIKSTSNYTDEGTIATKKTYEFSELVENYEPKLYYTTNLYYLNNNQPETSIVHHRLGKAIMGSQPYITYGNVIERNVNPFSGNADYGEIVHKFFNNPEDYSGSVPQPIPPFAVDYYGNIKKGSLQKQSIYDAEGTLLSTSENSYLSDQGGYYRGTEIKDADINAINFIQLYWLNGKVNFRFIQGSINGFGDLVPPGVCDDYPNISCLSTNANSRTTPIYTFTSGQYLKSAQTISTQYLGNAVSTQTSKNYFDPFLKYLLKTSTVSTSKYNTKVFTQYKYPEELTSEPFMANLISANRISTPVKVSISKQWGSTSPILLSTQKTLFDSFNGKILPESLQTAKRENSLEARIIYHQYDSYGNPVEVSQVNGTHTSYLWGYYGQYPVAKVENATYAEITAAGIGVNLSIINNPTSEAALLNELNKIRNGIPNAQVTTFTYLPLIGVSTITDPRGDKLFFQYDELNRLLYVIDKNGNRISENEYNYRINN